MQSLSSYQQYSSQSYFILCLPIFLLPSIFPSIRVFSNKSVLRITHRGAMVSSEAKGQTFPKFPPQSGT